MPSPRPKIAAFDTGSLALIEQLYKSTWNIFELRHPFRDQNKDESAKQNLRLKLFILAEDRGLADLDDLQQSVLQALTLQIDE